MEILCELNEVGDQHCNKFLAKEDYVGLERLLKSSIYETKASVDKYIVATGIRSLTDP